LPREAIEISRQIDYWHTILGLPLLIMLTIPSSDEKDQHACRSASPKTSTCISAETQKAWAEEIIPLLIAKSSVYAVVWNQFCDAEPHDYAHGGLFDSENNAKPVLSMLESFRQQHLN
jgi:hypothetical protein